MKTDYSWLKLRDDPKARLRCHGSGVRASEPSRVQVPKSDRGVESLRIELHDQFGWINAALNRHFERLTFYQSNDQACFNKWEERVWVNGDE